MRLWNTAEYYAQEDSMKKSKSRPPFKIIAGHHGGTISSMREFHSGVVAIPLSTVLRLIRPYVPGIRDPVRIRDSDSDHKQALSMTRRDADPLVPRSVVDPTSRFLITASGDRGWQGESTRVVLVHEIKW